MGPPIPGDRGPSSPFALKSALAVPAQKLNRRISGFLRSIRYSNHYHDLYRRRPPQQRRPTTPSSSWRPSPQGLRRLFRPHFQLRHGVSQNASKLILMPRKRRPSPRPSPLRETNLPQEYLSLGLDLFETLLHDVADANDAREKCSAAESLAGAGYAVVSSPASGSTSWSSDSRS